MAQPTTRTEFKEWCLRKLGKPVIEINVDQDQVDDRVDEALAYYWDYHFDGTEKLYYKYQVTDQDKSNKYITIPENIIGVVNIFDLSSSLATGSGMFNVQYQFVLNNLYELVNFEVAHFWQAMEHIQFMEKMLVGSQPIRYNRNVNKLYIDTNWDKITTGNWIIVEAYQIVDPTTYADMWKDRWLQNYATAKIKYQWGSNLTKFSDMQLPGGVRFNGEKILGDAEAELRRMEDEMISSFSLPIFDLIG
jgi:hypothetical protein